MTGTLAHPGHEHALIMKKLRERCSFECDICKLRVRGTAYCCEEHSCSFFLHEPCALVELPLQISDHPIHPDHPLVLESCHYTCHGCRIELDASVVIATLPPLEVDHKIQHVAHDHPLAAFRMKVPDWSRCSGCLEKIPGPAYGCHSCRFFLHESCARLPQEMLQQPFHPEHPLSLAFEDDVFSCDACGGLRSNQLAYGCRACNFKLDFRCAALPLSLKDQEKEAQLEGRDHFSHKHRLLSGHVKESEHTKLCCAVCELEISGEVYYCLGCIFFLHKQCADELVQDMGHYLHAEHRLILRQEPPYEDGTFGCDCCGKDCPGMVFHCASCDFDLDPRCALQTFSASRDGAADKIQHFSHDEHPLVLAYIKQVGGAEDYCMACYMQGTGLVYRCDKCNYVMHKSCAELPSQLEHPLHPSHPLVLLPGAPDKPHRCDNCSSESGRFRFYCTECVFYLCLECATKTPTLKHQLHEHTLSYFERSPAEDSVRCNYCGENCSIDLYRCTPCNFNLHAECLPLPPTIEHECHPYHPLVLIDRYVDLRPDDLWCDYCEEIRHPDRGVYRCEECWYTVHIGCVLPQVRQHENPYLDKLKMEVASLKETIEEREKDLDALKERLSRLEIEVASERAKV